MPDPPKGIQFPSSAPDGGPAYPSTMQAHSRHQRIPSRTQRFERTVDAARRTFERGNEQRGQVTEDEWKESVENLLMVIENMTAQLATHDELSAQLKIAQSNLTLAASHSDFLEETLRRRDSQSVHQSQPMAHRQLSDSSIVTPRSRAVTGMGGVEAVASWAAAGTTAPRRPDSDGSTSLYGLGLDEVESLNTASSSSSSTAATTASSAAATARSFFSRAASTSGPSKKPSSSQLNRPSSLETSTNPADWVLSPPSASGESSSGQTPSSRAISSLMIEVAALKSQLANLQSSFVSLESSRDALAASNESLVVRCRDLEKTKNDLMDELERLSVELFQEANMMVSEERKKRAEAESEVKRLSAQVGRLTSLVEKVRRGEIVTLTPEEEKEAAASRASSVKSPRTQEDEANLDDLIKAEEELELALGLQPTRKSFVRHSSDPYPGFSSPLADQLSPPPPIPIPNASTPNNSSTSPNPDPSSSSPNSQMSARKWFQFRRGRTATSPLVEGGTSSSPSPPLPGGKSSPMARMSSTASTMSLSSVASSLFSTPYLDAVESNSTGENAGAIERAGGREEGSPSTSAGGAETTSPDLDDERQKEEKDPSPKGTPVVLGSYPQSPAVERDRFQGIPPLSRTDSETTMAPTNRDSPLVSPPLVSMPSPPLPMSGSYFALAVPAQAPVEPLPMKVPTPPGPPPVPSSLEKLQSPALPEKSPSPILPSKSTASPALPSKGSFSPALPSKAALSTYNPPTSLSVPPQPSTAFSHPRAPSPSLLRASEQPLPPSPLDGPAVAVPSSHLAPSPRPGMFRTASSSSSSSSLGSNMYGQMPGGLTPHLTPSLHDPGSGMWARSRSPSPSRGMRGNGGMFESRENGKEMVRALERAKEEQDKERERDREKEQDELKEELKDAVVSKAVRSPKVSMARTLRPSSPEAPKVSSPPPPPVPPMLGNKYPSPPALSPKLSPRAIPPPPSSSSPKLAQSSRVPTPPQSQQPLPPKSLATYLNSDVVMDKTVKSTSVPLSPATSSQAAFNAPSPAVSHSSTMRSSTRSHGSSSNRYASIDPNALSPRSQGPPAHTESHASSQLEVERKRPKPLDLNAGRGSATTLAVDSELVEKDRDLWARKPPSPNTLRWAEKAGGIATPGSGGSFRTGGPVTGSPRPVAPPPITTTGLSNGSANGPGPVFTSPFGPPTPGSATSGSFNPPVPRTPSTPLSATSAASGFGSHNSSPARGGSLARLGANLPRSGSTSVEGLEDLMRNIKSMSFYESEE
ncbi:hypothetical protein T439DRAFT_324267 [Meredithblackwellia eburnea MCA 4105]